MQRALTKALSVIIAMALSISPPLVLGVGAVENDGLDAAAETVGAELNLDTDAHLIQPGEVFYFGAYFTGHTEGNTAVLRYSFDAGLFECLGFTPAEGVLPISVDISGGEVKVYVMIPDYGMSKLGMLTLKAREDAVHSDACYRMSLLAEYVVKDSEGVKEIKTADISTIFVTLVSLKGDTDGNNLIDLLDLSNILDWLGFDTSDPDWYEKFVFFDFNNNKEIDISDVCYVAAHIGDIGGEPEAELESIKLVSLPEKLAYTVGENLDLSGMEVQAVYADGTLIDVTDLAVTDPAEGELLDTVGTIYVSVSFEGRTSGFDVIVSEEEQLPEITELNVRPTSIIATLAAYVHVEYTGNNLEGRQVYVSMLNADGDVIGEPALARDGNATLYIPAAPADAGDYGIIAEVDGVRLASEIIKVTPYDSSVWTMSTEPNKQGYIVLKFNADIVISDGNISNKVSLNGSNIAGSLGADGRSIVTGVKYDDLASGTNTFEVKGVKCPALYPSYTFTFTAEVIK